jgi:mono/diheme cytochrome c family protein
VRHAHDRSFESAQQRPQRNVSGEHRFVARSLWWALQSFVGRRTASPLFAGNTTSRSSFVASPAALASVVLATSASLTACEDGAVTEEAPPTYYQDLKPILDAKCATCHDAGGIGPFPLTSYEEVHPLRESIARSVAAGTMPPWPPASGCNDYVADRSLSAEERELLSRWVARGGPEGDPDRPAPPLDVELSATLSRVDRSLRSDAPYLASDSGDDYRCFVLDWPETEPRFITGFGTRPGDVRSVHHAIAFAVEPSAVAELAALDAAEPGVGYACYGGPLVSSQWVGVWTPGTYGADFPRGTGIRIEPGSKLVLQVHYSARNGPPAPDQTEIDLRIDASVEREAWIQPFFDPSWYAPGGMPIPAHEPEARHSVSYDPTLFITQGRPILMHTIGLHMHSLGTRGRIAALRANGDEECLLDIPDWDFHWQGAYGFSTPKRFAPGDRIYQECQWDNTRQNQPIVNGQPLVPMDVDWGEAASDEMCLGAFYLTLDD